LTRAGMAFALSALLMASLCLGAAGAAAGSTSVPGAGVAKKKSCKHKKKPKSAGAAKKKGCKKKKPASGGPTVRASMTWNDTTRDMDLHVFQAGGAHSGVRAVGPSDSIPGTTHSYEVPNGGPETFTDLVSPSTRQLSIYACFDANVAPLAATVLVTTRVTDPGGGVRTIGPQAFPTTMRWQLITTSPPGLTPVPVPDPNSYCAGSS
jgi:hypothetical protein